MKSRLYYLLVFILLVGLCNAHAQSKSYAEATFPKVGEPVPDFLLINVKLQKMSTVSSTESRGRWLFLDFFYYACNTCLRQLPKTNQLYTKLKSKMDFVVVVDNSAMAFGKGVQPIYERLVLRQKLTMPYAIDSALQQAWEINTLPYIIIVDPKGIVRVLSNGLDFTEDKLLRLMKGEEVSFRKTDDELRQDTTSQQDQPVLTYTSRIKTSSRTYPKSSNAPKPTFRAYRTSLKAYYFAALVGKQFWIFHDSLYTKVFQKLIFEVRDTSMFDADYMTGKGLYDYELNVPRKIDRPEIMATLLKDLEAFTGYTASLEDREVPVWKLVALPNAEAKLKTHKTNNETELTDYGPGGFSSMNYPIDLLHEKLTAWWVIGPTPLINATGIQYHIDITINAAMTDREAVLIELQRNGLDLVRGTMKMKAIVIRDRNAHVQ